MLGGENNYGYVNNPLGWVDPLGLAGCKDWGAYYSKLSGTKPPESMVNPHAHHIVFKGNFSRSPQMQKALNRSGEVLAKYKIDPVEDVSALMWAENKGHTVANAKLVADKLEAADRLISGKVLAPEGAVIEMKSALQKIGFDIFGS
ncbi:hypothetical protein [Aeromonas hydrophila]